LFQEKIWAILDQAIHNIGLSFFSDVNSLFENLREVFEITQE
jgi:hypothetical protein